MRGASPLCPILGPTVRVLKLLRTLSSSRGPALLPLAAEVMPDDPAAAATFFSLCSLQSLLCRVWLLYVAV